MCLTHDVQESQLNVLGSLRNPVTCSFYMYAVRYHTHAHVCVRSLYAHVLSSKRKTKLFKPLYAHVFYAALSDKPIKRPWMVEKICSMYLLYVCR